MNIAILILKIIVIVVMAFLSSNILSNQSTKDIFSASAYVSMLLLVVGTVMQLAGRFNIVDVSVNVTPLDILAGFSVIYVIVFIIEKSKKDPFER